MGNAYVMRPVSLQVMLPTGNTSPAIAGFKEPQERDPPPRGMAVESVLGSYGT